MSVTINLNPSGSPSVQDTLWHIATSDNSGSVDMKYVFDIWINGVQKVRVKQFPEPSNGKAYFDAGPVVRNSMTYEWFEPINSSAYVSDPNMSGQIGIIYAIRVGEEVSGITTTNMASGEVSGYNWAPSLFKHKVTDLTAYDNDFVTNRGDAYIGFGENLFLGLKTIKALKLKVDIYNQSNSIRATIASGGYYTPAYGFTQMNIGTAAINTYLGNNITEDDKFYEVYFEDASANVQAARQRVYLRCNPKYTCIPVHFLNRLGMWETLRFDLASRLMMDVERKSFGKRGYKFGTSSVDYKSSSNRFYETKVNHLNKAMWNYKLTANMMTDIDHEWAAELINSPQLLAEIDGYFYPFTIKTSNYEYSKFVNDKMKPLELEFEMNQTRYTQLR
jgi:hypothetical protein